MTTLREAALGLSALGWHVFPLGERSKVPATEHGCKDATDDTRKVGQWWAAGSTSNVGVATGAGSDVIVVDVDGPEGEETLRSLQAVWGPIPDTVEARTGKGRHLYFRYPGTEVRIRNSARKLGAGLDIRTDGGYVVAPPSVHPTGGVYEWVRSPQQVAPASLPDWLLQKLVDRPKPEPEAYTPGPTYGHTRYGAAALAAECRELAATGEGARNDRINSLAFRVGQLVRARHLNEGMARAEVEAAAAACGVDRQERKARDTYERAFKAGFDSPNSSDPDPDENPAGKLRLVRPRGENGDPPPPTDAEAPARGEPEATAAEPEQQSITASEAGQIALDYLTDEKRLQLPRSGFGRLDDCIGGFPPGSHTTIGGTTGSGKSSLALSIGLNQCGPKGDGHRVGFLSLEDPEWLCGARVLSHLGNVNAERFFGRAPDPEMVGHAILGVQAARAYGLHFAFAIGKPLQHVLRKIDHLTRVVGCNVIIVDYLQAIAAAGQDNRYAARTDAAQAIKGMCHDRGASLILLSQLRRPETGSPFKEPTQTALKDSGDIENMSECIILLWPMSDAEGATVMGKVSKVKWSPKRARFAVERNPATGALVGLSEPPDSCSAPRNRREDDYA